ncbi:MAG: chromate transporter, partial [Planctomycetaceae bacterium]|nr:chromate transporter [Planctomycetaceae bacterium]
QMLDGLGMAETTPGPLIMVVQFVGFMGGYRQTVDLPPLWGGILGACITTWVTFVPCFLWIFLGGPYVERIRNNQRLSAALKAITASVVGVILNLAVWFSLQTLFQRTSDIQIGWMKVPRPDFASVDLGAILIAAVAFLLIFRFRRTMVVVLPACCGLGILWKLFL